MNKEKQNFNVKFTIKKEKNISLIVFHQLKTTTISMFNKL